MRVFAVVLALGLLVGEARADIKVAFKDGRMDISATRANVSEILDRVARQTGMKVIYDGPRPQKTITKSVSDRTPADAVLGILEGEGINFAVILNPAGTQIETLLVTGPSKAKAPRPGSPILPGAMPPPPDWAVDNEIPPPPPPPAPMPDQEGAVPGEDPQGANNTPTPQPPSTLATPTPQPSSSFTPQGPGPILLPPPGGTPPPTNR